MWGYLYVAHKKKTEKNICQERIQQMKTSCYMIKGIGGSTEGITQSLVVNFTSYGYQNSEVGRSLFSSSSTTQTFPRSHFYVRMA